MINNRETTQLKADHSTYKYLRSRAAMMEDKEVSSTGEEHLEDEAEDFDERSHASLLKNLSKMDGNMKASSQRREITSMSEYQAPTSRDHVRLHELVGALEKQTSHRELKKQMRRVKQNTKVLPVPLCKPEQERVHRTLAYVQVSKDVSQWHSIVQKNRQAEQLKFPLEQPDLRMLTSADDLIKRTQPKTSLELDVATLLGTSQTVIDSDTSLTPAEHKALQAMSIEEARERRAELQKYRVLLSYEEAKARRQNKIKSKKYHRILQKEKLKKEKKSLDELEKSDPEAFAEKLRRLDADRMQERISLKHRGGSKFAKKQAIYKKYDDKTRDAIQEMLHKSRELSKKVAVETDSSGAEESDGDEVPPANNSGTTSEKSDGSKANPWMTAGLRISKKAKTTSYSKPKALQNSSMVESDSDKSCDNETVEVISSKQAAKEVVSLTETDQEVNIDSLFDTLEGKNIPTIRQMKHQKYKENISIEDEDSDEEEDEIKEEAVSLDEELMSTDHGNSSIKMSLKRKKTMEDFEVKDDDDDDEDELKESVPSDAEEAVSQEKEEKSVAKVEEPSSTDDKALSVDPNQFMTLEGRRHKVLLAEEDDSEEEEMDNQSLTIAQAFATDDVIDEFSTEKRSIEERDKPKNVSMVLPGWGEWGGEGVQVSNRKKKRFTLNAAPAAPRKDRALNNVIISEVKDRTISKHQVSDVPFPFNDPSEFESSIRQPIGKTWNPETAYKKLIQPKKVTRMGTVILPMDKSQLFTKEKHTGPRPWGERKDKK